MRKDIRWLAGFLEGEGFFCVKVHNQPHRKGGKPYKYLQACVGFSLTDKDVATDAARLLGNKLYGPWQPKGKRKPIYACQLLGSRAVIMMQRLYKQMGQRRKKQIKQTLKEIKRG